MVTLEFFWKIVLQIRCNLIPKDYILSTRLDFDDEIKVTHLRRFHAVGSVIAAVSDYRASRNNFESRFAVRRVRPDNAMPIPVGAACITDLRIAKVASPYATSRVTGLSPSLFLSDSLSFSFSLVSLPYNFQHVYCMPCFKWKRLYVSTCTFISVCTVVVLIVSDFRRRDNHILFLKFLPSLEKKKVHLTWNRKKSIGQIGCHLNVSIAVNSNRLTPLSWFANKNRSRSLTC